MADVAKPRWYRLTPGRCLIGLLAVEGLLLLSQRFAWFAFNQHKGWTVLVAMAAAGVALLLLLLWFAAALIFRWRFQFSVRSLLVLTVAVAIPCSWLAAEMKKAREQKTAVKVIEGVCGRVNYFPVVTSSVPSATLEPPGAAWPQSLPGEAFFTEIVWVDFHGTEVTDNELKRLGALPRLKWLHLSCTQITDASLDCVKSLGELQELNLENTQIGDTGLARLKGLTNL